MPGADAFDFGSQSPAPPRGPWSPVAIAIGCLAVFAMVTLAATASGVAVYFLTRQPAGPQPVAAAPPQGKQKLTVKKNGGNEPPPMVKKAEPAAKDPPDLPKKQPDPEPEKAPAPPAETAQTLLEKGRQQYKAGDLVLAEQTWLKALDLCGKDRDDQILKAELYLRVGLTIERIDATNIYAGKSAFNQQKTLIYYQRFNELLLAQEIQPAALGIRQHAIQQDHLDLWLQYGISKTR